MLRGHKTVNSIFDLLVLQLNPSHCKPECLSITKTENTLLTYTRWPAYCTTTLGRNVVFCNDYMRYARNHCPRKHVPLQGCSPQLFNIKIRTRAIWFGINTQECLNSIISFQQSPSRIKQLRLSSTIRTSIEIIQPTFHNSKENQK